MGGSRTAGEGTGSGQWEQEQGDGRPSSLRGHTGPSPGMGNLHGGCICHPATPCCHHTALGRETPGVPPARGGLPHSGQALTAWDAQCTLISHHVLLPAPRPPSPVASPVPAWLHRAQNTPAPVPSPGHPAHPQLPGTGGTTQTQWGHGTYVAPVPPPSRSHPGSLPRAPGAGGGYPRAAPRGG